MSINRANVPVRQRSWGWKRRAHIVPVTWQVFLLKPARTEKKMCLPRTFLRKLVGGALHQNQGVFWDPGNERSHTGRLQRRVLDGEAGWNCAGGRSPRKRDRTHPMGCLSMSGKVMDSCLTDISTYTGCVSQSTLGPAGSSIYSIPALWCFSQLQNCWKDGPKVRGCQGDG